MLTIQQKINCIILFEQGIRPISMIEYQYIKKVYHQFLYFGKNNFAKKELLKLNRELRLEKIRLLKSSRNNDNTRKN